MIDIKGGFFGYAGNFAVGLGQVGVDHDDVHIRRVVDERIFPQYGAGQVGTDDGTVFPRPLGNVTVAQSEKFFLCYLHNNNNITDSGKVSNNFECPAGEGTWSCGNEALNGKPNRWTENLTGRVLVFVAAGKQSKQSEFSGQHLISVIIWYNGV